jgi:flagellar hook-basal body complex protein FliE
MTVEAISFIPATQPVATDIQIAPSSAKGDFASWMDKQVGQVNDQILQSDNNLQKLATGQTDNLHQVMLSLEEAKMSFQLFLQVRNRLLEAYQEVIRMPI